MNTIGRSITRALVVVTGSTALLPGFANAQSETTVFVARLGVDTVAIERIVRSAGALDAQVIIRSPRTVVQRHTATMDVDGRMSGLEVFNVDPTTGRESRSFAYVRDGDSLRLMSFQDGREVSQSASVPSEALPFIDLVHWPFDLHLRGMRRKGVTAWNAPMLSRLRVSEFPLAFVGDDSATVTHPTRGTMRLSVHPHGGIRTLDAGATTRALVVVEGGDVDIRALAADFAARDAAGRGVGALSGRDSLSVSVGGAEIRAHWGTPLKRGREIWGALVPYGRVWRTGANQATHFSTNRPLRFGTLVVPAGTYTLFSIIEESGGTLIINTQTGQNGQSYDETRDLGRVRLHTRPLDETVESFTLRVDGSNEGGVLRLQWDRKEYFSEFALSEQ